ncbi:MAG: polyprenol monophosphomannose synthase [Candidatus Cardinium sp.]|uniref:polyprenol monophosphomannose synthase n=1 Tax=Cardinium endosymbiont of Dermatophagoides farinae TaxID=2597823 RepID=UPI001183CFC4|nr:polyprenol monophosphomannose synthase [Cardinium endosymbiont of Dermatophagoides farinae]TSJ81466.1 polyprenol monophosphomannose synthase [Cardinium endosymbiont of Dermatophagoides farinae]UWW96444.1 MAG: polyprenol monophosphomannose synthase [Candidatus Cardinium sp.]
MSTPLRAIVVIPTYNEQENIELLLTAILGLNIGLHVLVVDDHSPDGTADIVIRLQPYYPGQLHLLNRLKKEGLGRAYLAGFSWALAYHYDYICSMDADFSHAPTDLPRLLAMCAGPTIDMVIGSRYITGGRVVNWPLPRILLSRIANWLARSITGMPIQDTTAGFVCYRRTILQHILNISSVGYSFQIEIKFLAYEYGAKIVELPITFINRVRGSSKMGLTMAAESIFRLIQMKWRS